MCHSSHTDKRNAPNDDGMNTKPKAKQIKKKRSTKKLTIIHTHIRCKYEHCTTATAATTTKTKNLTIKRNMFMLYAVVKSLCVWSITYTQIHKRTMIIK